MRRVRFVPGTLDFPARQVDAQLMEIRTMFSVGGFTGQFLDTDGNPARLKLERPALVHPAGVRPQYRVMSPMRFTASSGVTYTVPVDLAANSTDLASIPWTVSWLVPVDGAHTAAAILHDAFIEGSVGVDYEASDGAQVSDVQADRIFREAMGSGGVLPVRQWLVWTAVALRSLAVDTSAVRRWVKLFALAVGLAPWAYVAALQAAQVPGFVHGTIRLNWLIDQSLLMQLVMASAAIVAGTAWSALWSALVFRRHPALGAGALAGAVIGFLALPMVVSTLGWLIYALVERVVGIIVKTYGGNRAATAPVNR
jgi:hypothetical protein